MSCWGRRLPVALLILRNAIRSAVEQAAWSAIGQETKSQLEAVVSSNPYGYPHKPLVSYRINRQLSGWILPPPRIRAVGAHCQHRT